MYKLYNDDLFNILPTLNNVNLVIADLPYNTLKKTQWDKEIINLQLFWEEVLKCTTKNATIILFGSTLFTAKLMLSNPKMFSEHLIWNKNSAANVFQSKKQHLKIHEDILVFHKNKNNYFPIMTKGKLRKKNSGGKKLFGDTNTELKESYNDDYYPKNILNFSNASNKGRIHIAQKPVELLEYLIKTYSNENDLIIDPVMGSGSTIIAAHNTTRNSIGIEKDKDIFLKTAQRIIDNISPQKSIDIDNS